MKTPRHSAPGQRTVALSITPVALHRSDATSLKQAGAWRLRAPDRRFGGVSALGVDGAELVAITDSGAVLRFAKPGHDRPDVHVDLLPGDLGRGRRKSGRDSEALVRDPGRRGWWVAFENRNQLRLYDHRFGRVLGSIGFGRDRWPRNAGIEGLAADSDSLLLFSEFGGSVVRVTGANAVELPLAGSVTRVADAAALPDGRLLLLERQPGLFGFTSAVVELRRDGGVYAKGRRFALNLGARDNPEALAAESLAGGGTRLWLMTDDNFQPWLRTLLVAYDMPARRHGPAN